MRRFYNFLRNMVRKRPSPESNNDEQTNEASDTVFQQDDNAKRVKLSTLCDTTLQDLPMELIECILIKAVVMEVKGMKLVKSVWKEKADRVISRLRTVCPQWNNILTTTFFRNEVYRILDGTGPTMIRMEILHQSPFLPNVRRITTLKDEIFLLCFLENDNSLHPYTIHVYDRNNMAEVKEVIPLPKRIPGMRLWPQGFAACRMSNSVYVLCRETLDHISFLRITRDDQRQFSFSPLISHQWMPDPTLSVAANGNLILLRKERSDPLPVICMYNANGSVQHEIRLSLDITNFWELVPKSNGNFIFVLYNVLWQTKLTEVDTDGAILRLYHSSLCTHDVVCHADMYGRILLSDHDQLNKIELLDSEFNRLDFTCSQLDGGKVFAPCKLHYNGERNEIVAIVDDALTIFHFTEE